MRGPKRRRRCGDPHPLHKRFGLPDFLRRASAFLVLGGCSRPSAGGCRRGGDLVSSPPLIRPRLCATTATYWRPFVFTFERHGPGGGGEQRMIGADADIAAGMEFRAALSHDYHAADDLFAAEFLDAETAPVQIAAVARRTACLLMGHVTRSKSNAARKKKRWCPRISNSNFPPREPSARLIVRGRPERSSAAGFRTETACAGRRRPSESP